MKKLQRQEVTFDFTGQVTDTNDRKIQPGELTELVNTRRVLNGRLEKRVGYDKTTIDEFSGGTYAGPATEMLPDRDAVVWRDSADQIWALNSSDGVAYHRGHSPRAFPTWHQVSTVAPRGSSKPIIIERLGQLWEFSIQNQETQGIGSPGLELTIFDKATRTTLLDATAITGAFIVDGLVAGGISAVVDGDDNVWLFFFGGYPSAGDAVFWHKYTDLSGVPTAKADSFFTGLVFSSIDAQVRPSGQIVLALTSHATGGGNHEMSTVIALFSTTGSGSISSSRTDTETSVDTQVAVCNGVSIVDMDGSLSTAIRIAFWRAHTATAGTVQLILRSTTTALGAPTDVVMDSMAGQGDASAPWVGVTGGHMSGTDVVVYGSGMRMEVGDEPILSQVNKWTWDGVATVEAVMGLSAYLASKPVKVGSSWYHLTGFDDGPEQRVQRGYFLRDSDGRILTTILDGEAGAAYFGAGLSVNVFEYQQHSGHVVTPIVDGTNIIVPLLQEGETATSTPAVATLQLSPAWRSTAEHIVVGGVPRFVSGQSSLTDYAPIHFPYVALETSAGDGPGTFSTNRMTYRYAFIDPMTGDVRRSAHAPVVEVEFLDNSGGERYYLFAFATLRHVTGDAWVEVYGSVDGGTDLFLQATIANDPTAHAVTANIYPLDWTADGELLDTTGDALDQSSLPPARIAVEHNGRLWLIGTPDGSIWFSQEKRPGRGYEFNESLVIDWPERKGTNWSAAQVSPDVLAVSDGVSWVLISGPGPDGLGIGAFTVQTVQTKKVPTNPHAVVSGPLGVYFQEGADGRQCVLTQGGVQGIGQGAESYRSMTFVGSVHVEGQNDGKGEVRFASPTGDIVVLDCDRPFGDQAAGQWSKHSNTNLPEWVGLQVVGGAPVLLEAGEADEAAFWQPGSSYDDDGTAVLKDWSTGRMSPPGLQREFDVDDVLISSEVLGGDSAYEYTLTSDVGVEEDHPDAANAIDDVQFRANRMFRTRDVRLRVRETSATGRGRAFDSVTMTIRPYGRTQFPRRRIA